MHLKKLIKTLIKLPFRWVDPMFHEHDRLMQSIHQVQVDRYISEILKQKKYKSEKNITKHGFKAFSQFDEDGIIEEIFNRVGVSNKTFLEIGVGDGLENNSLYLLTKGWSGIWIEGSKKNVKKINTKFEDAILSDRLKVIEKIVTAYNVNRLAHSISGEIDFFSIDIDGNDYHVIESINFLNPRVICLEYNAKFRPPTKWIMKRNDLHWQNKTDYFGASLESYCELLERMGYQIVACTLTGANAFFVRNDLMQNKFQSPHTAEFHYEPCRYPIAWRYRAGMPPDFGPAEKR